ncbi:spore germination protein [Fictibacillus iocasae]|uniref:Spore germination protein n=1 Tax=Fictibacillus iocasae TaxID=2715437 RepID=A0ABW2NKW8_9BACL
MEQFSKDSFSRHCASHDFVFSELEGTPHLVLCYYSTMQDNHELQHVLLPRLKGADTDFTPEKAAAILPVEGVEICSPNDNLHEKLCNGNILLLFKNSPNKAVLIPGFPPEGRPIAAPEIEFSVVGPKEAFVESIEQNVNLIRKRLPLPEFRVEYLTAGTITKTKTAVLYIEGIANQENVNTVTQRIRDIQFDHVIDTSYITQMIADNTNSLFPQVIETERPDRVTSGLAEGKVIVLVDGSPQAIISPTTLVEFFSSFEDYFYNWQIASAFRLIRLFAVVFSILATPMYVAILTFHYELVPNDLLNSLRASRSEVPFSPFLEAMILELTIELLREAGARLPVKVGQTIGIVGGIVIGTASVEAGLTSNILLIIVALSALASFTTPVYQISNTIRLIRFPFIFLASIWGLLGITLTFAVMLGHLLQLKSLGRPFLEPINPLRLQDLKDAIIRLPFSKQKTRPRLLQSSNTVRIQDPHPNKGKQKLDIEE